MLAKQLCTQSLRRHWIWNLNLRRRTKRKKFQIFYVEYFYFSHFVIALFICFAIFVLDRDVCYTLLQYNNTQTTKLRVIKTNIFSILFFCFTFGCFRKIWIIKIDEKDWNIGSVAKVLLLLMSLFFFLIISFFENPNSIRPVRWICIAQKWVEDAFGSLSIPISS